MKLPNSIDVSFELVTPAYAGGAHREATDGLRPPTLKALLRFWWRAIHPELAPAKLFEREAQLFGAASTAQGLRLAMQGPWAPLRTDPVGQYEPDFLHVYMAYGPVAWDPHSTAHPRRAHGASVLKTPRIHPQQEVGMRLYLPAGSSPEGEADLLNTCWALSAFGGYGSRHRRGWGSLRAKCNLPAGLSDPHAEPSAAAQVLRDGLQQILGGRDGLRSRAGEQEPRHTAFSIKSRLFVGRTHASWHEALTQAKDAYYDYHRRLGAEHRHAPGAVGPDHRKRSSWLAPGKPVPSDSIPAGSAFGLPHNAQFSPPGKGPTVHVGVGPDLSGRRASPVFIKVIGNGKQFTPVVLWLPALFLPTSHQTHVSVNGGAGRPVQYGGDGGIVRWLDGDSSLNPAWPGLQALEWQEVVW